MTKLKKYFAAAIFLSGAANINIALAQKQPQPVTINICTTPQNALESFKDKVLKVLMEEKHKPKKFQSNQCKQETVMSNDVATIADFKGLGNNQKFNQEHPALFEVYFTDADCERQCLNKAGGWISSYELPIKFWPEEKEWHTAMKNRLVMGYAIEQMKAADKVSATINNYPESERVKRYNEARDEYTQALNFIRKYGF